MNIYLDDNLADETLGALLVRGGHAVVRPNEVGLRSASDAKHFEHAIRNSLMVLTSDRDDFRDLHQLVRTSGGNHLGILVVHYENNEKKDMKPKHISAAIGKLERSGTPCVNELIVLNHWR